MGECSNHPPARGKRENPRRLEKGPHAPACPALCRLVGDVRPRFPGRRRACYLADPWNPGKNLFWIFCQEPYSITKDFPWLATTSFPWTRCQSVGRRTPRVSLNHLRYRRQFSGRFQKPLDTRVNFHSCQPSPGIRSITACVALVKTIFPGSRCTNRLIVTCGGINRQERKGEKPSDHAPMIAAFEVAAKGPG